MKYLFVFVVLAMLGCGTQSKTEKRAENDSVDVLERKYRYQQAFQDEEKSLVYWTNDSLYCQNTELVELMDVLFQHVRTESFPALLDEELKWMDNFGQRLYAYYDHHHPGDKNELPYVKVDSVMSQAVRLYNNDEDTSTMTVVVNNGILRCFSTFLKYYLFNQIESVANNDELRALLRQEWEANESIEKCLTDVCCDLAVLKFMGGSIIGPVRSQLAYDVVDGRAEMYRRQLESLLTKRMPINGNHIKDVCGLLIESCKTAYSNAYTSPLTNEFGDENDQSYIDRYEEYAKDARDDIERLQVLLVRWNPLWEMIGQRIGDSETSEAHEMIASMMLSSWIEVVEGIDDY